VRVLGVSKALSEFEQPARAYVCIWIMGTVMSFLTTSGEDNIPDVLSASADALNEGQILGEGSYGQVFACRPLSAGDGPGTHAIKIVPLHGKNPRVALTTREQELNLELRKEIEIMQRLASHRSTFVSALLAH
jgi:hypothetical protein